MHDAGLTQIQSNNGAQRWFLCSVQKVMLCKKLKPHPLTYVINEKKTGMQPYLEKHLAFSIKFSLPNPSL